MEELKDLMEDEYEKVSAAEIAGVNKIRDLVDKIRDLIAKNDEKAQKEAKEDLQKFDVCDHIMDVIAQDIQSDYCSYKNSENIIVKRSITKCWMSGKEFDPDVSLVSIYMLYNIYNKKYTFGKIKKQGQYKYEIDSCDNTSGVKYRGDTMNSWGTTLRQYMRLFGGKYIKDHRGKYIPKDYPSWESYLSIPEHYEKAMSNYVNDFMQVVYTIGNFILIPFSGKKKGEINSPRGSRNGDTRDYWDLALLYIYEWFNDNEKKDEYLRKIVGDTPNNIALCKEWLKQFDDKWDNFVEKNFMQPFVKEENSESGKYGEPYELWEGHFVDVLQFEKKGILPKEKWQFEQFFKHASERIQQRSELIAQALIEK